MHAPLKKPNSYACLAYTPYHIFCFLTVSSLFPRGSEILIYCKKTFRLDAEESISQYSRNNSNWTHEILISDCLDSCYDWRPVFMKKLHNASLKAVFLFLDIFPEGSWWLRQDRNAFPIILLHEGSDTYVRSWNVIRMIIRLALGRPLQWGNSKSISQILVPSPLRMPFWLSYKTSKFDPLYILYDMVRNNYGYSYCLFYDNYAYFAANRSDGQHPYKVCVLLQPLNEISSLRMSSESCARLYALIIRSLVSSGVAIIIKEHPRMKASALPCNISGLAVINHIIPAEMLWFHPMLDIDAFIHYNSSTCDNLSNCKSVKIPAKLIKALSCSGGESRAINLIHRFIEALRCELMKSSIQPC